jgi:hypothetical protein
MTILILVGHPATNPLEVARDVAARRDLATVIDVQALAAMMGATRSVDPDTARVVAIDLACGMATRLDALGLHAILVDAHRPGDTNAFRTRLLLVETYTIVALLAQHDRQVRRDLGRDPAISSDPVAYRSWHRRILDARTPTSVTHVDFDVIIDITRRAPSAETVALLDALL